MSTIYQVRTLDKSEVLSSGRTPEQAVGELIEDYGVNLSEISDYYICQVTQEHRVTHDLGSGRVVCRLHEHITNSWKVSDFIAQIERTLKMLQELGMR